MAQTTDGMSFSNVQVEISTNGTAWDDISGFAAGVTIDGGERQIGEEYTADGDTAIICVGKRAPLNVKVRTVYTEESADPFETVRAAYEAGSVLYVRWAPAGGATGDFQYTSDAGYVPNPPYPGGEVKDGKPVMFEFTLVTPKVTKSDIT